MSPKGVQKCSKNDQELIQIWTKFRARANMGPIGSQSGPQRAKMLPKRSQNAPKKGPKGAKKGQKGPKKGQGSPKSGSRRRIQQKKHNKKQQKTQTQAKAAAPAPRVGSVVQNLKGGLRGVVVNIANGAPTTHVAPHNGFVKTAQITCN